jgi:inner membrane transporter RhtA
VTAALRARGGPQASAIALAVGGAFSVQTGAAVAVLLFPLAGALGVLALRLGVAALVLLLLFRPGLRGRDRADWAVVAGFGVCLAGMNGLFYQALERIPLGAAVTLEILGPLTLSVVAARRASAWLWAALGLAGVALLGRSELGAADPTGVAFALGAGVMWAAYIVLSQQAGRRFAGGDGLALAMTAAAALTLPLGVAQAGITLLEPRILALGAVVGLLSATLPYTLELMALRRLRAETFAVLQSLQPAVAALVGFVVLGQALDALGVMAVALVVTASAGAVRAAVRRAGRAASCQRDAAPAREVRAGMGPVEGSVHGSRQAVNPTA